MKLKELLIRKYNNGTDNRNRTDTSKERDLGYITRIADTFAEMKETEAFDLIVGYCSGGKGGPLGYSEVCLKDDNGEVHIFEFESFSFYHQILTLEIYKKLKPTIASSISDLSHSNSVHFGS